MSGPYPWRPARVRVGTVGRAHGLDGSFAVESPCGWWAFEHGSSLVVAGSARSVRRRAGTDARPLLALEGVSDREGADALRGAPLELAAGDVPPPEPDAWFRFDLVGCEVVQGETSIGPVVAVEDGVANDVLVIAGEGERRLPFVAAVVPVVDVVGRRIEVDPGFALDP